MQPFDKSRAKDLAYLRGLIGMDAVYAGEPYQVMDVLEDGPQLVLQHASEQAIQEDIQGRPYRRVPKTVCIHTLTVDGEPSDLLDLVAFPDEGHAPK